jgi:hypothetical protein
MAKVEESVFRHAPVPAGGGTIQAHALGLQVVHPQQLLGECPFKSLPARVITQGLQHGRQPGVAQVQGVDLLASRAAQGLVTLLGPGLHVVQAMICLGQDMHQPQYRHPAQAQAHPIAMGEKLASSRVAPSCGRTGPPGEACHRRVHCEWSGARPWCTSSGPETLPQLLKPLKI